MTVRRVAGTRAYGADVVQPWESTLLLALLALVVADRVLGRRSALVVDGLVVGAGALTAWSGFDLSWQVVCLWVAVAAAAADQVTRLSGERSPHDPFGLLARSRSWPAFSITSMVSAVAWSAGLVLAGRLLGGLTHLWFLALVGVVVCVVSPGSYGDHRVAAVGRRR